MLHGNRNIKCLIHNLDNLLISGSEDGSIKVWNYLNGQFFSTLPNLRSINSLVYLENMNKIASGSSDDLVRIWPEIQTSNPIERSRLEGHTNSILFMNKKDDGILATESLDRTVKIWNINSNVLIQTLDTNPAWTVLNAIVYYQR